MLAGKKSRNGWRGIRGLKYNVRCNRCNKTENVKSTEVKKSRQLTSFKVAEQ